MSTRADADDEAFWGDADDDVALHRYRTLVNAIDDGLYQLDADGHFVAVNDVLVETTGYTRDDLLGEHVSLVLADADVRRMERELEGIEAIDDAVVTVDLDVRTADGETLPCELRVTPLLTDGEFRGSIGIVRGCAERNRQQDHDISDQKESAADLRESEDAFRSLVDAVEEYAIFRLDAAGNVISWNKGACKIKGYDREEILGDHFSTFYTEADRAAAVPERNLERALNDGSAEDEGWRVRKDGTRFWATVTITPIRDDDGSHQGYLKVTRDMTDRREREQELEGELQRILGRISDAFYAVDDEFRFTHVNDRAAELLQRSESELLGKQLWEVFPDLPEIDPVWDAFHTALETQEPTSYELYYDTLDFWVESNLYPSETGISVYFRDVTERRERERELERTERRFEAIFEDPNIFVGLLEPDGTVIDINGTAMGYVDAALEDVIGDHFCETPWWDESGRAVVREWTDRAAAGEYVNFEIDLARPTGVGYTLDGVFRPVTNEAGDVVSIVVSARDITARKKRERELEESEQRYRTLAEHFPNGVVTLFDHDLEYTLVAGQGFDKIPVDPAEAEGEHFDDVWPTEANRSLKPALQAALEGEERSVELEYAGREWIVYTVPITDSRGDVFAGVTMAHDITERKQYQRQLEETIERLEASNKRLEQFAYAASHDLQEPLRMISSYLQLIESRYAADLDADGEEFIDYAVDGAERMRDMIEGLLAYSRVETQGTPLEPVDLESILESVLADLQLRIEETNADIEIADLPRVEGDARQLRQVFQNLLSNAIEYTDGEPPRIAVDADRRGSEWLISVRDEGIGIAPGDQDRVFEVFQRLHSRENYSGTGIGLALSQRIIERHGGEIRVDSEPGVGSTFSLTLPAVESDSR